MRGHTVMRFDVYVDGSYRKRHGRGAAAGWVILDSGGDIYLSGSRSFNAFHFIDSVATELLAVNTALQLLPVNSDATVYTDCQTVVERAGGLPGTEGGHKRAHGDILRELSVIMSAHNDIRFEYIEGHSNYPWNVAAHDLAFNKLPPFQPKAEKTCATIVSAGCMPALLLRL